MKRTGNTKWVLPAMAIAAALISVLACLLLYRNVQRCTVISRPEGTIQEPDLMYEITTFGQDEMVTLSRNGMAQVGAGSRYLTIEGWAGIYGEETSVFDTDVLLQQEGTDRYLQLKTAWIGDRESPEADNGGVSFARGWFVAKVAAGKLTPGETYRVCIWYKNDGHNALAETEAYFTA